REANQAFWPSDAAIVEVSYFWAMTIFDGDFRQTRQLDHRFHAPRCSVSTVIPDTRVALDSPSPERHPPAGRRTGHHRRALSRSPAGTMHLDARLGELWGSPH